MIASHLELSDTNRTFVASLEDAAGQHMVQSTPVPLKGRDEKLAAIFLLDEVVASGSSGNAGWPQALVDFMGHGPEQIKWRFKIPGMKEYVLARDEHCEAVLYWIKPGVAMPKHTHAGTEATLVIEGGFSDESGDYDRGDVALGDENLDHTPVADAVEGCICFAVVDAPLRLTGPIGA